MLDRQWKFDEINGVTAISVDVNKRDKRFNNVWLNKSLVRPESEV